MPILRLLIYDINSCDIVEPTFPFKALYNISLEKFFLFDKYTL